MFKIVALCLAGTLLLVLLKPARPEYAMLLLALLLVVFAALLESVGSVVSGTSALMTLVGENGEIVRVMLKALGLSLVAQTASDLCKDSGEQTLAGIVELAAKIGILIMALPLAAQLAEMCLGWLQ